MTLYDDLGVRSNATEAQIKAAHRAHVRRTHPDNGGSPEAFARGQHAYEVLIDPRRRQYYDETGGTSARDPEAAERAEVLEMIGQALMQFVGGDADIECADVAGAAAQVLRQAISEGMKNKAKLEAGRERIDQAARRFKLKDADGEDLVGQVLEGRRRSAMFQIDKCEHSIRVASKALEALDGYIYQVEELPSVAGLNYRELAKVTQRGPVSGVLPGRKPVLTIKLS